MKILEPAERGDERSGSYRMVVDSDGKMHCSCGRELIKLDESTYRCAAGWPMYQVAAGDIIVDKFGNLLMREIPHGGDNGRI